LFRKIKFLLLLLLLLLPLSVFSLLFFSCLLSSPFLSFLVYSDSIIGTGNKDGIIAIRDVGVCLFFSSTDLGVRPYASHFHATAEQSSSHQVLTIVTSIINSTLFLSDHRQLTACRPRGLELFPAMFGSSYDLI